MDVASMTLLAAHLGEAGFLEFIHALERAWRPRP